MQCADKGDSALEETKIWDTNVQIRSMLEREPRLGRVNVQLEPETEQKTTTSR